MAELNTQNKEPAAPKLNEREIVAYLKAHPDFLARHPDLLEAIELKHRSGSAVSLIGRQVELLRAKSQRLEGRMERLLEAARDNERRQDNVHRLARTLIRSEEHTSELQSLMRISYAVFCLKKKKKTK